MRALLQAIENEAARRATRNGTTVEAESKKLTDACVTFGRDYCRKEGTLQAKGAHIDDVPDDAILAVIAYRLGDRSPETYSLVRLLPRHVSGRSLLGDRLRSGLLAIYWAVMRRTAKGGRR